LSQGCVTSDGKLSERALSLLKLLAEKEGLRDSEIAEALGRPFFQVRSSLRELTSANFLEKREELYYLTEKAKDYLNSLK